MSSDEELLARVTRADLAPGERRARSFDPGALDVRAIASPADPLFAAAYKPLWREFGSKHEMESMEVIHRRMSRDPTVPTTTATGGGVHLSYQLLLVRDVAGAVVAVRDHTAIAPRDGGSPLVVVHLSHLWIDPAHRGSGLAGWMRAWPIETARACAVAAGLGGGAATVLVAEMEHPDPADDAKTSRLIAYEKAGFRKVDPAVVGYLQPDFRDAATIDADVPRPLPMALVVRRVGREADDVMSGADVRRIVEALYAMYAADFRASDMTPVYDRLAALPADDATVALVPPTG